MSDAQNPWPGRVVFSILIWLIGAQAVGLATVAAAIPVFRHNEATVFVYDLIDDIPYIMPAVGFVAVAALAAAVWLGRSWKLPLGIVVTGVLLAAVALVIGHILFVPWVGK